VGEVVRVESVGSKLGVAVKLTDSRLERRHVASSTMKR